MQTSNSSEQTNVHQADQLVFTIPTKRESRSSETQQRMYRPGGMVFDLLTRDIIADIVVDDIFLYGHFNATGRISPVSVLDGPM
jgi:hypothetical protein